jgi:hypothetical protein
MSSSPAGFNRTSPGFSTLTRNRRACRVVPRRCRDLLTSIDQPEAGLGSTSAMHRFLSISFVLVSACDSSKTCAPQPIERFLGTVPDAQLDKELRDLASGNQVCTTPQGASIVMRGPRSSAVDAIDVAMKRAGFHGIPGRDRSDAFGIILSYGKSKDADNGNLVELRVAVDGDCEAGEVCVENLGYRVVPK